MDLLKSLEEVEKEEGQLKKRRESIEAKISSIRAQCPHTETVQRDGTFYSQCIECGKKV